MAKANISKTKKQAKQSAIPEKYLNLMYIGIVVLLIFIFFGGIISGGYFNASDNIASFSFRTYLADAKASGNYPQWVPHIFGGMPSYASLLLTGERTWDFIATSYYGILHSIGQIFGNDTVRVIMYYVVFAVGMFLLMRSKNHLRSIAMFTAIAAVFSTGIIHWIMIGHNTKPMVIAMLPFIFMFLEKLRVKFSLVYGALLVIALHIFFEGTHLQMIFYCLAAVGIYLFMELISRAVSKREPMGVIRAVGVLAIAGGMAFMMSADRYLSVQEYTQYSTRGTNPIVQAEGAKQASPGGNDYEYATMWSFSPQEIVTFFVPNYYGFGKLKYKGHLTQGQETKVPTYWGQKPFEDVAPYMGIFVFFLAIVGLIKYRKDVFIQSLAVISFFALLLSFGYTFPILYDLFYYYFPSFDKFRAPSMSLVLMQFSFPIMAGYGLKAIIGWREEFTKADKQILNFLLAAAGGFFLLAVIYALGLKESYIQLVASAQNTAQLPADIHLFIYEKMISDWFTTAVILIISVAMIYLYSKSKVSAKALMMSLTFLLLIDLWRVGYRGMEISDTRIEDQVFQQTDVVDFLSQDKSLYRVADFSMASPNVPAFFRLQNVGGYHPAKLRVYQDMLDVADQGSTSQVTNPFLWDLLNVKYIIVNQELQMQPIFQSRQTGAKIYPNPGFLPRVFFVDSIAKEEPIKILQKMKNAEFDPLEVAFFETGDLPNITAPTEEAIAEVVEFKNEYIKIKANATGNNLLFISEIYYPQWKAYLNGTEIPIYKTNYAFRSVVLPKGEHTLELKYESPIFKTGKNISLALNLTTVLLLGLGLFFARKKNEVKAIDEEIQKQENDDN